MQSFGFWFFLIAALWASIGAPEPAMDENALLLSEEQSVLLAHLDQWAATGDYAAFAVGLQQIPYVFNVKDVDDLSSAVYAQHRFRDALHTLQSVGPGLDPPPAFQTHFLPMPASATEEPLPSSGPPAIGVLSDYYWTRPLSSPLVSLVDVDYALFGESTTSFGPGSRGAEQLLEALHPRTSASPPANSLPGVPWDAPEARDRVESVAERLFQLLAPSRLSPSGVRIHLIDEPAVCQAGVDASGNIFMTRALYELATTDDVLAMVLGHELAHLLNDDHRSVSGRFEHVVEFISEFIRSVFGGDKPSVENAYRGPNVSRSNELEVAADELMFVLLEEAGYTPGGFPRLLSQCGVAQDEYEARLDGFENYRRLSSEAAGTSRTDLLFGEYLKMRIVAERTYHFVQLSDMDIDDAPIHPSAFWFYAALMSVPEDSPGGDLPSPGEALQQLQEQGIAWKLRSYVQNHAPPFAKVRVETTADVGDLWSLNLYPAAVYLMQGSDGDWQAIAVDTGPDDRVTESSLKTALFGWRPWEKETGFVPAGLRDGDLQSAPAAEAEYKVVLEFLDSLFNDADPRRLDDLVTPRVLAQVKQHHAQWHSEWSEVTLAGMQMWSAVSGVLGEDHVLVGPPDDYVPRLQFSLHEASRWSDGGLTGRVQATVRAVITGVRGVELTGPIYLPVDFILLRHDAAPGQWLIDDVL